MQKSFIKSFILSAITALAVFLTPNALAQLVSSGLTGTVRSANGSAAVGVNVTAVHGPTNATFSAVTNASGRYNFRGLPVGGPYSLSAKVTDGSAETTDVFTELGDAIEVNLTAKSEVLQLDKLVTTGSATDLDAAMAGASYTLNSERLAAKPSSERSFADLISATPMVTLRSTFGDREESQITAVGQNNRFNSIMIDGSRTNDVFGLNGTGLAAFFNPLSVDTIEQLSVQISPYDVRLAGFTGATINAVTKSGTNEFHGSAYYYFRGNSLFGQDLQGPNERERNSSTGAKITPKLERRSIGATLGGPIIRNKLFFFLNYEDFESISAGRDVRFSTPSEAAILTRLSQYSTASGKAIDWGQPVSGSTSNTLVDEKILAKLDWNINSDHRLSARYSKTDGLVPQFGNFAQGSSSNVNISGGVSTSSDGHFYDQSRVGESYNFQLFSQWNPDLKTEVKYTTSTDDQLTPVKTVGPMTYIFGLSGTDLLNNTAVTNGAYIVGTEQFRHGNVINVETKQLSALADYFRNNFVFTFGFEREQSDFLNLFRAGSYGLVGFRTLTDFLNDTNAVIQRNYLDPSVRPLADISEFASTGVFAQAKWNVNPRLNVTFGVRYEMAESGLRPALNSNFLSKTGFRNDGSMDGVKTFSPRAGFNWSLDDERKTQFRGGFGHFLGRTPWVFFSNSFGSTGVGTFSRSSADTTNPLPSSLTAYLRDQFDPANPIGTGTDNPTLRREVNFNDDKVKLPSVWRGNLALDRKIGFLDSVFTAEVVHSIVDSALRTTNENLRPTTLGADGRQRFAGSPFSQPNALFPDYTFIYRVSNADAGKSTYVTLSWDRPMRNKWSFNLAYTRGRSTEVQANGQTTAGGQFNRNAIFNQNRAEVGTADFEIKDRIQLSYTRRFEFIKNWPTTTSLYYEGRTGNPYSWTYSGDLNGDGITGNDGNNDLIVVPNGINDPRFDFSLMPTAQRDAMFAYFDSSGLSKYAGSPYVPKNSFYEPWVNRLDLKFVQDIPVRGYAKFQVFFDFINFGSFISEDTFGYTETVGLISNDVFRRRTIGSATYGPDGRLRPTFTATPSNFAIDNGMSRWRIQVGAKIIF